MSVEPLGSLSNICHDVQLRIFNELDYPSLRALAMVNEDSYQLVTQVAPKLNAMNQILEAHFGDNSLHVPTESDLLEMEGVKTRTAARKIVRTKVVWSNGGRMMARGPLRSGPLSSVHKWFRRASIATLRIRPEDHRMLDCIAFLERTKAKASSIVLRTARLAPHPFSLPILQRLVTVSGATNIFINSAYHMMYTDFYKYIKGIKSVTLRSKPDLNDLSYVHRSVSSIAIKGCLQPKQIRAIVKSWLAGRRNLVKWTLTGIQGLAEKLWDHAELVRGLPGERIRLNSFESGFLMCRFDESGERPEHLLVCVDGKYVILYGPSDRRTRHVAEQINALQS